MKAVPKNVKVRYVKVALCSPDKIGHSHHRALFRGDYAAGNSDRSDFTAPISRSSK